MLLGTVSASDRYADYLAAVALRVLRPGVHVVISDATIRPGSATVEARLPRRLRPLLPALTRVIVGLADSRRTTWCVLSEDEVELFPTVWPIRRGRVVFTPFSHTLYGVDLDAVPPTEDFLFAGGNSLRDYPLLLAALQGVTVPTFVASRWRPADPALGVSWGEVTHDEFVSLLQRCRALVLTLTTSTRSTSQQTFLNAMALGKIIVVTESLGVSSYVEPGVTGLVVPATPEAVHGAILHLLDPTNAEEMADMQRAAREVVLRRFTPQAYRARLLDLALAEGPR